jgi:hypothetical protein
LGFALGGSQRRQKQRRQNGDNRDNHEQFNQGKTYYRFAGGNSILTNRMAQGTAGVYAHLI